MLETVEKLVKRTESFNKSIQVSKEAFPVVLQILALTVDIISDPEIR